MPRKTPIKRQKQLDYYSYNKERINNPPVGLIQIKYDPESNLTEYKFQPFGDLVLKWQDLNRDNQLKVPTVSLHIHERIDSKEILKALVSSAERFKGESIFKYIDKAQPKVKEPKFYQYKQKWTNRLIYGDSLLVMNSFLVKEKFKNSIQMIYIDPPYAIDYKSNFQPFMEQIEVKDGRDEDLSQELEVIKAFRDTWELQIHSYLSYLRDRLLLAKELLTLTGSCFVQISDVNLHHVRELLDQIFGSDNFVKIIPFQTKTSSKRKVLGTTYDYILWYAKDITQMKCHTLYTKRNEIQTRKKIRYLKNSAGEIKLLKLSDRIKYAKKKDDIFVNLKEIESDSVIDASRIFEKDGKKYAVIYETDFAYNPISNVWSDTVISTFAKVKIFAVQTNTKVLERCISMTTDPSDLIFDPTCGSGTTAFAAESLGRRWITCDTSRIAITLTKQRMLTGLFEYYELNDEHVGVESGFVYNEAIRVELVKGLPKKNEPLYDSPKKDINKQRICGPFTVEAVPPPLVASSCAKNEQTKQNDLLFNPESIKFWADELLKSGIIGRGRDMIKFIEMKESKGDWIHFLAKTGENPFRTVAISFGPEFDPLEQRQIEKVLTNLPAEIQLVVFCAFQFDPIALNKIFTQSTDKCPLLPVQMNTDLFTSDLKKKMETSQSFWLLYKPKVKIKLQKQRDITQYKCEVKLEGFDYYNPIKRETEFVGADYVAIWMLDPNYDSQSFFPRQTYFIYGTNKGNNKKLSKLITELKLELDPKILDRVDSINSIPFLVEENQLLAIKLIDNRGIETILIKKYRDELISEGNKNS